MNALLGFLAILLVIYLVVIAMRHSIRGGRDIYDKKGGKNANNLENNNRKSKPLEVLEFDITSNDKLLEIWPRYKVAEKLGVFVREYVPTWSKDRNLAKEQYELDSILERYLVSTYPKILPKDNSEQIAQLQKELTEKHISCYGKILAILEAYESLESLESLEPAKSLEPLKNKKLRVTIGSTPHDDVIFEFDTFRGEISKSRYDLLMETNDFPNDASNDVSNDVSNDSSNDSSKNIDIFIALVHYASLMPNNRKWVVPLFGKKMISSSQQWAVSLDDYRKYIRDGITVEGFASPFNSQIIRLRSEFPDLDLKFCSISPADAPFGSLGSFFDQNFEGKGVLVNPPFTESLLQRAAEKCLEELEKHPCKFIFNGPNWTDAKFYELLDKSPYKVSKKILPKSTYSYEDLTGNEIKATFNSVVFILERL